MPLQSRNVSPKTAQVFVPIGSITSSSPRGPSIIPIDGCSDEVRTIISAALIDPAAITIRRPADPDDCDSPVLDKTAGVFAQRTPWLLWRFDIAAVDSWSSATATAAVAGALLALWTMIVLPSVSSIESHETPRALCVGASLVLALLVIERLLACAPVVGVLGSDGSESPPLARLIISTLQVVLGNVAGAVIASTCTAAALLKAADGDWRFAGDAMGLTIDAARDMSEADPAHVFVSGVAAGAVLTAAYRLRATTYVTSRVGGALVLWAATFVIAALGLHVGIVDKTVISATATFNSMRPLARGLGPHVFNYGWAIAGNCLGAAAALSLADLAAALPTKTKSDDDHVLADQRHCFQV